MLEEQHLIKKAKRGESEAFGLLYDKYLNQIYRFVYLKVSHKQIAEDLTHQVFLSAWQNLASYQEQGFPFSSWLYQIARNAVVDHYRVNRGHLDLKSVEELADHSNLAADTEDKLNLERIKAALQNLPSDYQDAVVMRFIEELSHREIAAALNKSEGAVRVLQHRALNQLKKIINNNGRNNPKTQKV